MGKNVPISTENKESSMECEYCKKKFKHHSENTLNVHKQTCKRYHKFMLDAGTTCKFCKKQFPNKIFKHLKRKHKLEIEAEESLASSPYSIFPELVLKKVPTNVLKKVPIPTKNEESSVECEYCMKKFKNLEGNKQIFERNIRIHKQNCKRKFLETEQKPEMESSSSNVPKT